MLGTDRHTADHCTQYLGLRLRMAGRLLSRLGVVRCVVLAGLLLIVIVRLAVMETDIAQWMVAGLGCAIVGSLHLRRRDIAFLQSLNSRYQLFLTVEYILISLPLSMLLVLKGAWGMGGLLLVAGGALPFLYQNQLHHITNPKDRRPFPPVLIQSYEWVAGFRRYGIFLALLWLLTAILLHNHFLVGWAGTFLLTTLIASFYVEVEPAHFVTLIANKPRHFLLQKVASGVGKSLLLMVPLWVGHLLLYPDWFLYTILFGAMNVVLVIAMILVKYTFYERGADLELPISTIFMVFCTCFIVPYLLPMVPLAVIWLFHRATKRLKNTVYAHA